MYLYLNINQVILDIVEDVKPLLKNKNGIIIPCYPDKAEGYMGTNEKIYAKAGYNFVPTFEDVFSYVAVSEIPEYVQPRFYKYVNGEFVQADKFELSPEQLTQSSEQQRADIDYIAMETGVDL